MANQKANDFWQSGPPLSPPSMPTMEDIRRTSRLLLQGGGMGGDFTRMSPGNPQAQPMRLSYPSAPPMARSSNQYSQCIGSQFQSQMTQSATFASPTNTTELGSPFMSSGSLDDPATFDMSVSASRMSSGRAFNYAADFGNNNHLSIAQQPSALDFGNNDTLPMMQQPNALESMNTYANYPNELSQSDWADRFESSYPTDNINEHTYLNDTNSGSFDQSAGMNQNHLPATVDGFPLQLSTINSGNYSASPALFHNQLHHPTPPNSLPDQQSIFNPSVFGQPFAGYRPDQLRNSNWSNNSENTFFHSHHPNQSYNSSWSNTDQNVPHQGHHHNQFRNSSWSNNNGHDLSQGRHPYQSRNPSWNNTNEYAMQRQPSGQMPSPLSPSTLASQFSPNTGDKRLFDQFTATSHATVQPNKRHKSDMIIAVSTPQMYSAMNSVPDGNRPSKGVAPKVDQRKRQPVPVPRKVAPGKSRQSSANKVLPEIKKSSSQAISEPVTAARRLLRSLEAMYQPPTTPKQSAVRPVTIQQPKTSSEKRLNTDRSLPGSGHRHTTAYDNPTSNDILAMLYAADKDSGEKTLVEVVGRVNNNSNSIRAANEQASLRNTEFVEDPGEVIEVHQQPTQPIPDIANDKPQIYRDYPVLDPSSPSYDPFKVHVDELTTPEKRQQAEARVLLAALNENPTNSPSRGYRRSTMNDQQAAPRRQSITTPNTPLIMPDNEVALDFSTSKTDIGRQTLVPAETEPIPVDDAAMSSVHNDASHNSTSTPAPSLSEGERALAELNDALDQFAHNIPHILGDGTMQPSISEHMMDADALVDQFLKPNGGYAEATPIQTATDDADVPPTDTATDELFDVEGMTDEAFEEMLNSFQ